MFLFFGAAELVGVKLLSGFMGNSFDERSTLD
jgi:hypothetical protein